MEDCGICLENIECIKTKCNHSFCSECIMNWCKNRNMDRKTSNCPYCNIELPEFDNLEILENSRSGKVIYRDEDLELYDDTNNHLINDVDREQLEYIMLLSTIMI